MESVAIETMVGGGRRAFPRIGMMTVFSIESVDHPPDVRRQKRQKNRFQIVLGNGNALIRDGLFNVRIDIKPVATGIDDKVRRIVAQIEKIAAAVPIAMGIRLSNDVSPAHRFIGHSSQVHGGVSRLPCTASVIWPATPYDYSENRLLKDNPSKGKHKRR